MINDNDQIMSVAYNSTWHWLNNMPKCTNNITRSSTIHGFKMKYDVLVVLARAK